MYLENSAALNQDLQDESDTDRQRLHYFLCSIMLIIRHVVSWGWVEG